MTNLTRVAALEASGRAALPALHEEQVGQWLLRVSGGSTKRVNSANPLAPNAPLLDIIAAAEQLYAAHHLPCRFRLTPLANAYADRLLEERGYEVIDRSWTMVAPLSAAPTDAGAQARAASQPDPSLRRGGAQGVTLALSSQPDAEWLARVEPLSGRTMTDAAVQARLLATMPGPLALATVEDGGEVLASGYASIGHGRAQLSDIVVAPHARGRGLGRRLVAGLLGWAQAQGCEEAMLQVLDSNIVARALYRSLGFTDAYRYHYRVRR